MALRWVHVTLPVRELERVEAALEGLRLVDLTMIAGREESGWVQILVDAEYSEALGDTLFQSFGGHTNFRMVSMNVEATLPKVEEPKAESEDAGTSADSEGIAKPHRISRDELYADLSEASRPNAVYLVTVTLSTIVAAIGLMRGDTAVLVGSMVIAPLLGPNMSLALAATLGDVDLAKQSAKAIGVGVMLAGAIAVLLGIVLPFDPDQGALLSRTQPSVGDIALALAAGSAGALAFTSGVPAVVVGVMVAVALLPPLVVAGLFAGTAQWQLASGALVLVATNVTCVNLAAVATFLAQKVRPRTWWEAKRARRATRIAVTSWILMLILLVGLMFLGRLREF